MRDIVSIFVGQCGIHVGAKFFEYIAAEHGIDVDGNCSESAEEVRESRAGTYFNQTDDDKFPARAVLIDIEHNAIEHVRKLPVGQLFKEENIILGSGKTSGKNNWAKGHYTERAELIDRALEAVRREADACKGLRGFQLTHSLGGGFGSGFGTLLLSRLREEYPDSNFSSFSIIPSAVVSDTVVEPYNAALGLQQLIKCTDVTYCIDNEAVFYICHKNLEIENPTYADLNHVVAQTMASVTSTSRFACHSSATVVPPVNDRLHFFSLAFAPIVKKEETSHPALSVTELTQQVFDPKNLLISCDPSKARYLSLETIYRAELDAAEVHEQLKQYKEANPHHFIGNITEKSEVAPSKALSAPSKALATSAAMVVNSTAISQMFNRLSQQFNALHQKKAFMHWYLAEGMTEEQFVEAKENLESLVSEYKQLQDDEPESAK